jgi:6-pyruvoyltetrahydropterin/6-carboxytetrahydropterin synthase
MTRRYRMAAAHILSNPRLSDGENDEIFGKCANPNGHGHDYEFEVTVTGPIDPLSGQIVPPGQLDAVFEEAVGERYSHSVLNRCEGFEALVPTTENLAEVVYQGLSEAVERRTSARLVRVRVTETPRNTFECGELQ